MMGQLKRCWKKTMVLNLKLRGAEFFFLVTCGQRKNWQESLVQDDFNKFGWIG